jgi:hypothetical protein
MRRLSRSAPRLAFHVDRLEVRDEIQHRGHLGLRDLLLREGWK